MASETLDADNKVRERRKWGENNKVYTRKFHRKKTQIPAAADPNPTTITAADATISAAPAPPTSVTAAAADNPRLSPPQTLPAQEQPRTVISDDSPSRNPQSTAAGEEAPAVVAGEILPAANGVVKPVVTRVEDRVKINLKAATSKNEIRELREKLMTELDQVRSLFTKLEDKEAEIRAYSTVPVGVNGSTVPVGVNGSIVRVGVNGGGDDNNMVESYSLPQYSGNDVVNRRGLVRVHSEVGSVVNRDSRPYRQLSVSVVDDSHSHGIGEFVEKEKRTPKANQYYRNSDFLLGKDRLPPESNKKARANGGRKHGRDSEYHYDRHRNQVFKSCSSLLQRLMKHKHGWVFNEPVNAKLLGLLDYHEIIKHPMDLGTVKSRLAQNFYKSPKEFAEDVRLTFRNAMTYNPRGQDVHVMAEQLSNIFEEKWASIESSFNPDWRYGVVYDVGVHTPTSRMAPPFAPAPSMRSFGRSESMPVPFEFRHKPSNLAPVSRTPAPRKPKAKDPNKRDMTYEEKQKLSTNLQGLPSEKLDNIVQIIKKRNTSLSQHDDEIEVDIDSVDAETLWELDRFVTNYKKSLSKHKRKAELALQARAEAVRAVPAPTALPAVPEAPKENRTDEKSLATASPGQGKKQTDNASRSSSSSSSSSDSGSSSSDSDSDSSSGDGSDAEHSPRS